ncbi:bifunctional UDP-N-acetylglucosamine diphosphorylase/glucosamine-1-phosphate N-acetyltransferase GlmU [Oleispirillum naphthae]|uniref:bifunctional UDP-N-acetylglucosamine diphosphorylase/glucosamine-1-phosphate N-acetyltransferase GlmU n=1 Tax=Oleispirillum naphthae TaxID=2838853 RepID=UPI003082508A
MSEPSVAAVILAAGLGTRMKSELPKVMHPVCGRPMLAHVLALMDELAVARRVVVSGPDTPAVAALAEASGAQVAVQAERLGTAHAVLAAKGALAGHGGDVLVAFGDTPLISAETVRRALDARRSAADPAVVVLGFDAADPGSYGRLILGAGGALEAIVEAKDATPEQRAVTLCNSGVMVLDGRIAWDLLSAVGNANAKGEYYLTDAVALARAAGRACAVVEGAEEEFLGVNTRADLAALEATAQTRLRAKWLAGGVTMTDPTTVYFSADTRLGRDVVIDPFVVFGPGVSIGDDVTIKSFCHFENAQVAAGAILGPYARLRPGAEIGPGAHIGNFVEIKKSRVEEGAKVNHLTYIGDARVGAGANVGAGTITCNYDGFTKSFTDIGAGAFIGSNTSLVAPVTVGDGAIVGAGSVVTHEVPADALAVTRAPQKTLAGWAARFRAKMRAAKAKKN